MGYCNLTSFNSVPSCLGSIPSRRGKHLYGLLRKNSCSVSIEICIPPAYVVVVVFRGGDFHFLVIPLVAERGPSLGTLS